MKTEKENPPYLPKVAYVRLHTAGKTAKDYQRELKGQGFTFNQFKHMAKCDEYWDGLELWVSLWNYDNHESWHLWNWKKEDDNRIMMAIYEAEQFHPYERYINDFGRFMADWKLGTYDPGCTYTFPLAAVEIIEVVQEEQVRQGQRRSTGKRKGDRRAAGMGKKHCMNKQEVLQRARQQKQKEAGKPQTILQGRLQTINQIKPAMEKAGKKMREEKKNAGSSI